MQLIIEANLQLELLETKHSQELFELANANRIHLSAWMPWIDAMQSSQFIEDFIQNTKQRNLDGLEFAFVIIQNSKIIGRIGLYKIDSKNKIGELGYWIGQEFQGQGLVLKSCSVLLDFAFNSLHLNRIEIKCGKDNLKSQKIPQLLNFKFEGILRQGEKIRNNFIDLKIYSLVKKEYHNA